MRSRWSAGARRAARRIGWWQTRGRRAGARRASFGSAVAPTSAASRRRPQQVSLHCRPRSWRMHLSRQQESRRSLMLRPDSYPSGASRPSQVRWRRVRSPGRRTRPSCELRARQCARPFKRSFRLRFGSRRPIRGQRVGRVTAASSRGSYSPKWPSRPCGSMLRRSSSPRSMEPTTMSHRAKRQSLTILGPHRRCHSCSSLSSTRRCAMQSKSRACALTAPRGAQPPLAPGVSGVRHSPPSWACTTSTRPSCTRRRRETMCGSGLQTLRR
mmetsp:Transcript_36066/g.95040  ORF Transcript_36066/g.95040 Transcript_36066/m.95040 type:complete len:270 (+) Transcript_36066:200-1009(+)